MVIKSIVLIKPTTSQYDVQSHFVEGLYKALLRKEIQCRLLDFNQTHEFCYSIIKDPPDCTISFNGALPDQSGRLFFDVTRIPHVSILLDSVINFFYMRQSPYTILSSVDQDGVDFLQGTGHKKIFFMPHAIENSYTFDPNKPRPYDIVMLGSCIDYEAIYDSWSKYPSAIQKMMQEVAEIVLSDSKMSLYKAFSEAMERQILLGNNLPINNSNIIDILNQIELFVRGKDRVELIKSIEIAPVNIFGSGSWKKYLGNKKNVKIHSDVSFKEGLEIMQKSKILLNSSPQFKKGSHERVLYGLASGAAVITNKNDYFENQFESENSILFYEYSQMKNINSLINTYLTHEEKRIELAAKGRDIVIKFHTWDHNVNLLISNLNNLL